ncbi:hypothetical protein BCR33DRAFT_807244 [Rhizoclosmatium globosum]|uniref:L domain-like protein n=1 Tax=Rhizoclosmatium globosum TaxID=329046 RepID=A0A1Y2ARA8_9FUNG|nr:hypothetical protein BCR33DRAFT_807244 [Rhizoclosmatium globosum]|eukprot:ORY24850.1 hypothetical protein BCR33DRAFT_807244 [Rhizoclosmatium globosum]
MNQSFVVLIFSTILSVASAAPFNSSLHNAMGQDLNPRAAPLFECQILHNAWPTKIVDNTESGCWNIPGITAYRGKIITIDLRGSPISGGFPKLPPQLATLKLGNTQISGPVTGLPRDLLTIELFINPMMSGTFPTLPNKLRSINFHQKSNICKISLEFAIVSQFHKSALSDTKVTGEVPKIPPTLSSLYLKGNLLTGLIPDNLSSAQSALYDGNCFSNALSYNLSLNPNCPNPTTTTSTTSTSSTTTSTEETTDTTSTTSSTSSSSTTETTETTTSTSSTTETTETTTSSSSTSETTATTTSTTSTTETTETTTSASSTTETTETTTSTSSTTETTETTTSTSSAIDTTNAASSRSISTTTDITVSSLPTSSIKTATAGSSNSVFTISEKILSTDSPMNSKSLPVASQGGGCVATFCHSQNPQSQETLIYCLVHQVTTEKTRHLTTEMG